MRVTPRGGRDMLSAGTDAHLAAPPVAGVANDALVTRHVGVARRDVALVAGQAARVERLTVAGDTATLARAAASLYAAAP